MADKLNDDLSLPPRLAKVEESIEGIRGLIQNLVGRVETLANTFASAQRPNWQVYAAFIAIVFGLVAGGKQYIDRENDRQSGILVPQVAELQQARGLSEYQRGRADEAREERKADIAELKSMDDAMDIRLQREMRDVSAIVETKVNAMDTRLQAEITRNANERHEQLAVLRETVDKLDGFQRDAASVHADLLARVAALEKKP